MFEIFSGNPAEIKKVCKNDKFKAICYYLLFVNPEASIDELNQFIND